jgi:hypothetical protein
MPTTKDIKYVGKTFEDFKANLIEFTKNYFPDTYNDFSPASPGIMFIEMASYVGDVLSYYQDKQVQETFLQHAKDPANLYSLAYTLGYRPKISTASQVNLTVTQRVPAVNGQPNWNFASELPADTQVQASSGTNTNFILTKGVNFAFSSSLDPTEVEFDTNQGDYILSKQVLAFSAEERSTVFTVPPGQTFPTFLIEDSNILEVTSITDSQNNEWKEVPYLGQELVFTEQVNPTATQDGVEFNLKLEKNYRRFITRLTSTGNLQIQFGGGGLVSDQLEFLPNPKQIGLGTQTPTQDLDRFYDPSNFLYTDTYGVIPSGQITVNYLVGGGLSSNEEAGAIQATIGPFTISNLEPATGGRGGDSIQELRENSLRAFNEQGRVVTYKDYSIRALSMPGRFGVVSKVYSTTEAGFNTDISKVIIYILSSDQNGNLIETTESLKSNLSNYLIQYLPIGSRFEIKDAFIVNIGIDFEIIPLPNFVGKEVKARCILALQEYFSIDKWNINQPINLNPVYTLLDQVRGVQTVESVSIRNLSGGEYSKYSYDIPAATRRNVIYPSIDPCIFELKFPNRDIRGRITTL